MRSIRDKTKAHCKQFIEATRCKTLPYHNWIHTLDISRKAAPIGSISDLPLKDMEPELLAALFHDTGNVFTFHGDEELSSEIAAELLDDHCYPLDLQHLVSNCTLETKVPQQAEGRLERILCDADLFHPGSPSFFEKLRLLRKEGVVFLDQNYSPAEWYQLNIEFLRLHTYHTSYGRIVLASLKKPNIDMLEWGILRLQTV